MIHLVVDKTTNSHKIFQKIHFVWVHRTHDLVPNTVATIPMRIDDVRDRMIRDELLERLTDGMEPLMQMMMMTIDDRMIEVQLELIC